MATITKDLVFAYILGTDMKQDLREAIEDARENDPLVQYWFDLYSEKGIEEPTKVWLSRADRLLNDNDPSGGSPTQIPFVLDVVWATAAEGGGHVIDPPPESPPERPIRFDAKTGLIDVEVPAESIPFGVGRLTVKVGGDVSPPLLLVWTHVPGTSLRRATLFASELAIFPGMNIRIDGHVVPATPATLGEFIDRDADELCKRYEEDDDRRPIAEAFRDRIKGEGDR